MGIRCFESRRLRLYTDIPAEKAELLPPLTDRLYDALEAYFGAMPPDRAGTDFQMTGYLIRDLALFREAGLVPDDLPSFEHGRHRANEFWLRDQDFDYYRAHLLLHEAVHCFMTYLPDSQSPVWYLEGMAEHFATHRHEPDGSVSFGIMPQTREEVPGWGRTTIIRQEFSDNRPLNITQIFGLTPRDFATPIPYAWSWGLCHFLTKHPRYAELFQELGRGSRGSRFVERFEELFQNEVADLAAEWALFVVNLQYGYDVPRSAIVFDAGQPLTGAQSKPIEIVADHGWQSTHVELQAGKTYRVIATGQVTLADTPKPWVSEPQGISFDYADGQPVGLLLGCLRASQSQAAESMLRVLPIGPERTFSAPLTGTLYLRINDGWNRLADNRGAYTVRVEAAAP